MLLQLCCTWGRYARVLSTNKTVFSSVPLPYQYRQCDYYDVACCIVRFEMLQNVAALKR